MKQATAAVFPRDVEKDSGIVIPATAASVHRRNESVLRPSPLSMNVKMNNDDSGMGVDRHHSRRGNGFSDSSHGSHELNSPKEARFPKRLEEGDTRQDASLGRGSRHSRKSSGTHHSSSDGPPPPPRYSRNPPPYPVLLPEYRYCYKDGFVKPMRSHHCRVCGTVCIVVVAFCLDYVMLSCLCLVCSYV